MSAHSDPRLVALHDYAILDTPRESDFDDLVALASVIADTPVSVINLIDAGRQWFKAEVGLGVRETPLETSICARVMLEPDFIEVPDLSADPRFECNPLITEGPMFRFYAGVPLLMADGHVLGTLCVLGMAPKRLDERQRTALMTLGRQVIGQIELRRQAALASRRADALARAELALQRAVEALRAADARKDRFIATLAHELRNPLAPLRNASAMLQRPELPEDRRRWCGELIGRQVTHMTLLLDDLLDIARITEGKIQLRLAEVRLDRIVESALELTRPLIERKRHRLEVSMPPQPPTLRVDATRVAQIVANLLTNAAKYTDEGGRIQLRVASDDEGRTRVSVEDSGVGLTPAALDRVFEMFSQVDGAHERAEGGLGIGLALSRGLAELHGGSLTAASDGPGLGSRFTLVLPKAG